MDVYIETMNSISEVVPDSYEARQQRAIVWEGIIDLVNCGTSTGSKMLDRMLLQGRDTVEISGNVYHLDYVPSPAEHFMRQDLEKQVQFVVLHSWFQFQMKSSIMMSLMHSEN